MSIRCLLTAAWARRILGDARVEAELDELREQL